MVVRSGNKLAVFQNKGISNSDRLTINDILSELLVTLPDLTTQTPLIRETYFPALHVVLSLYFEDKTLFIRYL